VVMNLGINAAHAMQGRDGILSVRLMRCVLDAAETASMPELKPGTHLSLEIADTGTGMDAAVMARMFEPFFTTKEIGEGTGLGLAVVRSVVRAHGGAINVRSQLGAGSSFTIYLPAADDLVVAVGSEQIELPKGRGQRILLVDDEPMVLTSMRLMLEKLGYRVSSCPHPDEALSVFQAAPEAFDAVITDYQMPGKTGLELASDLRVLRPELPIVISSGFTGKVTAEQMRTAGVRALLPKPTSMVEIAQLLARVLG
jgi:CheY-like chemotaxis protein